MKESRHKKKNGAPSEWRKAKRECRVEYQQRQRMTGSAVMFVRGYFNG